MRRTYQLVTKWIIVLAMPLLVLFMFAPEQVIRLLFGERYTVGVTALRVLAIANFFSVCMGNNQASLISLGRNRLAAIFVIVQLIINGALDVVLIPTYGLNGAAFATMASIIVRNFLSVSALYSLFGVHPVTRAAFSPIAAVGIFSTVAYVVVSLSGLPVPAVVALVGLVYPIVVIKLALEPEDEELLTRLEERTGKDLAPIRRAIKTLR